MIFLERPASRWIIAVTIMLVIVLPLMSRFGKSAGEAEKAGT
jgi:putative tricarboxylic transport membrane protein